MSKPQLTEVHEACQTQFTRDGQVNMTNNKPYRTKSQKAAAKSSAKKLETGQFHSGAPLSWHDRSPNRKKRGQSNA